MVVVRMMNYLERQNERGTLMQQKNVVLRGDFIETYDGQMGVVRQWRVVEVAHCAYLDKKVPMVVLVGEVTDKRDEDE